MGKTKSINWRYQPPVDSDHAVLISYIQDSDLHPGEKTKEMILRALEAYYMPLALLNEGDKTAAQLQQIGITSVFALLRQVDNLCAALNLDRSKFGGIVPMGVGMLPYAGASPAAPSNYQLPVSVPSTAQEADIQEYFDPDEWNMGGLSAHSESFNSFND